MNEIFLSKVFRMPRIGLEFLVALRWKAFNMQRKCRFFWHILCYAGGLLSLGSAVAQLPDNSSTQTKPLGEGIQSEDPPPNPNVEPPLSPNVEPPPNPNVEPPLNPQIVLPEEPTNEKWPTVGASLRYLNGQPGAPSRYVRAAPCVAGYREELKGDLVSYAPHEGPIAADWNALSPIIKDQAKKHKVFLTLIRIVRIGGVPYFKYYSNGTQSELIQPWSSSKFLATAFALKKIRETNGKAIGANGLLGDFPLGDWITIIHNYKTNKGLGSNEMAHFFQAVSGYSHSDALIKSWLGASEREHLGSGYGVKNPFQTVTSRLGKTLKDPDTNKTYTLQEKPSQRAPNLLSTRTLAEALKRLVLFKELPSARLPGLTPVDYETLLYGAKVSKRFGNGPGGMAAGESAALYNAFGGKVWLNRNTRGSWQILQKNGWGEGSRNNGRLELRSTSYVCLPIYSDAGLLPQSQEFILSIGVQSLNNSVQADQVYAGVVRSIVLAMLSGKLK